MSERLFGRFTVLRRLGQGASGVVDAALDEAGTLVALKRIPLQALTGMAEDTEAIVQRFDDQASVLQRLRHPAVVSVLEHGIDTRNQILWLLLELASGHPLSRHTESAHLLPPALVLDIGAQLASGLAAAHALGLVHRDLKADNVRIQWPQAQVKLLDFGLAHLHDDVTRTATGVVMGTPALMAPELLAGATPSAASDVYALGALLYQLLCGRLPFAGHSNMAGLLRAVANEAPAPLGDAALLHLGPAAAAVQAMLASLLAKSPAARPADATTLAHTLRSLSAAAKV